jgi:hypothetical protein
VDSAAALFGAVGEAAAIVAPQATGLRRPAAVDRATTGDEQVEVGVTIGIEERP